MNNILFCLARRDWHADELKDIPHRNIAGDLAIYYIVKLDDGTYGKVRSGDEEKLYESAMKYSIEETKQLEIGRITGIDGGLKMPVLTYDDTAFGSGSIIVKAKELYNRIGNDYWLIPSSIHEWILVKKSELSCGYDGIEKMILEINDAEVPYDERLSDHPYELADFIEWGDRDEGKDV